jgi:Xaa-Pro aminopeptidase
MYLIINPSDTYFLTGIRPHDPGEILVLIDKRVKIKEQRGGIIFCDTRTSALFDREKYEIIDDRKKWEESFKKYLKLNTDPDFLTQTLREKIEGYGVNLHMNKSPITEQRTIKNLQEIKKLRASQELNKLVYEKILPCLKEGVTEEEIGRKIQILQLELGASGPSFPPIVAFGENTAIPHHSPTYRVLRDGDVVLIDM